jgi:hypothetical protein
MSISVWIVPAHLNPPAAKSEQQRSVEMQYLLAGIVMLPP